MAGPFYVDSGAGGANNGSSWTDAWTSFWSLGTLASGEIVYVASRHVEASVAASKTLTCPTSGEPVYIYSVTTGTTTYAAGAQVKTTGGSYSLTIDGSHEAHGITFESGNAFLSFAVDTNEYGRHENCTYKGGTGVTVRFDNTSLSNPTFDLTNDSAGASNAILDIRPNGRDVEITGGSIANASNRTGTLASVITIGASSGGAVTVSGVDLSGVSSSCEISAGGSTLTSMDFINCKMPETFTVLRSALTAPGRLDLWNSEDDDTETKRTRVVRTAWAGTVEDTDAVYMTDGNVAASDDGAAGTVNYSWLMTSNSSADGVNTANPLTTPWIYAKVTATGTKTLDVYFGAAETLDDAEVWVEFEYMATSGVEKFTSVSTKKVAAASATTYTSTGGTWSGTVTSAYYARAGGTAAAAGSGVTVNETGLVRARVCVGATSKTIYVNPKIIIG